MMGHTPHQSNMKIGSKFNHLIFANQTATQTIKGLKFRVLITRDRNLCDFYPCLCDLCDEFGNLYDLCD